MIMETWSACFNRGKHYLTQHKPRKALDSFIEALDSCPTTEQRLQYRLLFYVGVTLKKLRLDNSALRYWMQALKFEKIGYASKMVRRFVNKYGMVKQQSEVDDDGEAFFSIQLSKYLQCKVNRKFGSEAELDMVSELIRDTWKDLICCENFRGKLLQADSAEKKIALFQGISIVFPIALARQEPIRGSAEAGVTIPYNFRLNTPQKGGSRCFCGSSLPYQACCGRITSGEEIITGCF